jgi:hypothetical protein
MQKYGELAGDGDPRSVAVPWRVASGYALPVALEVAVGGGPAQHVGRGRDEQPPEFAIASLADPQLGIPVARLVATGGETEIGPDRS